MIDQDMNSEACNGIPGQPMEESTNSIESTLKTRERAVLRQFVRSADDKRVARALGIARQTATNHLNAIQKKCGVANRAALMKRALQDGIRDA